MQDRNKFRVWSFEQQTYNYKHPYNKNGLFYMSQHGVLFSDFGNCVAPETLNMDKFKVEFCTGRKDKNGVLIYDGDMLETHNGRLGIISFNYASFVLTPINEDNAFSPQDWGECEIIGNINKNPELMEASDE